MLSLLRDNCLGKEERILIIPEDLEHLKAKTQSYLLLFTKGPPDITQSTL